MCLTTSAGLEKQRTLKSPVGLEFVAQAVGLADEQLAAVEDRLVAVGYSNTRPSDVEPHPA